VAWDVVDQALEGYRRVKRLVTVLREKLAALGDAEVARLGRGDYLSQRADAAARLPRMRHLYVAGAYGARTAAFVDEFMAAMDDDLNGPRASAAIFGYVSDLYAAGVERSEDLPSLLAVYRALVRHLAVFGIDEVDARLYPELACELPGGAKKAVETRGGDAVVDRLLQLRLEARQNKDYAKGDAIRALLVEAGVEIEDTPKGPRWSIKR
jgi:cysteinyl-tRNA synthetase